MGVEVNFKICVALPNQDPFCKSRGARNHTCVLMSINKDHRVKVVAKTRGVNFTDCATKSKIGFHSNLYKESISEKSRSNQASFLPKPSLSAFITWLR